MWKLIRDDYWAGRITLHQAVKDCWYGYGPGKVRNKKLIGGLEFPSFQHIMRFLQPSVIYKKPNLP